MANQVEVANEKKARELAEKQFAAERKQAQTQDEGRIAEAMSDPAPESKKSEKKAEAKIEMVRCLIVKMPNNGRLNLNGYPLTLAKNNDVVNLPREYAASFPDYLKILD